MTQQLDVSCSALNQHHKTHSLHKCWSCCLALCPGKPAPAAAPLTSVSPSFDLDPISQGQAAAVEADVTKATAGQGTDYAVLPCAQSAAQLPASIRSTLALKALSWPQAAAFETSSGKTSQHPQPA